MTCGCEWGLVVHGGAKMAYQSDLATIEKVVRQGVTLPAAVARRVRAFAKAKRMSASRMLVELIERGLDAKEQERKLFYDLADRLSRSKDPHEQRSIKEELASITFGG